MIRRLWSLFVIGWTTAMLSACVDVPPPPTVTVTPSVEPTATRTPSPTATADPLVTPTWTPFADTPTPIIGTETATAIRLDWWYECRVSLRVRSGPGTQYPQVNDEWCLPGDVRHVENIAVIDDADEWWVQDVDSDRWVAYRHTDCIEEGNLLGLCGGEVDAP